MDLTDRRSNAETSSSVVLNCISHQFELVKYSEVVAVVGFAREGSHFDLVDLYVLPAYRGRGVARELVTLVLKVITASSATVSTACAYVLRIVTSDEYALLTAPPTLTSVRATSRDAQASSIRSRLSACQRPDCRACRTWRR